MSDDDSGSDHGQIAAAAAAASRNTKGPSGWLPDGKLDSHSLKHSKWLMSSRPEQAEEYIKKRERNRSPWGKHNHAREYTWADSRDDYDRRAQGLWNKREQLVRYFSTPVAREPGEIYRRDLQRVDHWSPRGGGRLLSDPGDSSLPPTRPKGEVGLGAIALPTAQRTQGNATGRWWEDSVSVAEHVHSQPARRTMRFADDDRPEEEFFFASRGADVAAAVAPDTDVGGGGKFFTFSLSEEQMQERDDAELQRALRRQRKGLPPVRQSAFSDDQVVSPLLLRRVRNQGGRPGGSLLSKVRAGLANWWTKASVEPFDRPTPHAAVKRLATTLEKNMRSFKVLELQNAGIGANDVAMLAKPLAKNLFVTEVDFRGNELGDEGAIKLAEALRIASTVHRAQLGSNDIGVRGAIALLDGKRDRANNVRALFLNANRVNEFDDSLTPARWTSILSTSRGIERVGKMLRHNRMLRHLSLSDNQIGDVGVKLLCKGLRKNTTLQTLNLANNAILDAGATSLAGVLVAQPNYLSLSLNNNRIGDVGATQLRRAVRRNRDLYMLDVANNRIGRRALAELRATLDLNIKEQVFRKNVYGKYAPTRTERSTVPDFTVTDTLDAVKHMGVHVESPMDDLVAEYMKAEGIEKLKPTPNKKQEQEQNLQTSVLERAAERQHRRYLPTHLGEHKKMDIWKNMKQSKGKFGHLDKQTLARVDDKKEANAQREKQSVDLRREMEEELRAIDVRMRGMRRRGRGEGYPQYDEIRARKHHLRTELGYSQFEEQREAEAEHRKEGSRFGTGDGKAATAKVEKLKHHGSSSIMKSAMGLGLAYTRDRIDPDLLVAGAHTKLARDASIRTKYARLPSRGHDHYSSTELT